MTQDNSFLDIVQSAEVIFTVKLKLNLVVKGYYHFPRVTGQWSQSVTPSGVSVRCRNNQNPSKPFFMLKKVIRIRFVFVLQ